jgi:hypothetical protein
MTDFFNFVKKYGVFSTLSYANTTTAVKVVLAYDEVKLLTKDLYNKRINS